MRRRHCQPWHADEHAVLGTHRSMNLAVFPEIWKRSA
jgi:hypothetical protein